MFNVFFGSSPLDAIILFCLRKHRQALAPITTQVMCYAPETNYKIESTFVTLALLKNIVLPESPEPKVRLSVEMFCAQTQTHADSSACAYICARVRMLDRIYTHAIRANERSNDA